MITQIGTPLNRPCSQFKKHQDVLRKGQIGIVLLILEFANCTFENNHKSYLSLGHSHFRSLSTMKRTDMFSTEIMTQHKNNNIENLAVFYSVSH